MASTPSNSPASRAEGWSNQLGVLWPECFRFAYSLTTNEEMAKDMCQNAVARVLNGPFEYTNTGALRSFLFQHIRAQATEEWRRNQRRTAGQVLEDLVAMLQDRAPVGPQDSLIRKEEQAFVRSAIDALPEMDRDVITMWMEGHSLNDIAAILGRNVASLSQRLPLIRSQLRQLLEPLLRPPS
jgi:RNA polymerase sigma factor (sigma-70 family)